MSTGAIQSRSTQAVSIVQEGDAVSQTRSSALPGRAFWIARGQQATGAQNRSSCSTVTSQRRCRASGPSLHEKAHLARFDSLFGVESSDRLESAR